MIIVSVIAVMLELVVFGSGQGNTAPQTRTVTTTKHHEKTTGLTPVATGMPYVQGTEIIDASGHQLILHGSQIESPFNYIKGWEAGQNPAAVLNPAVFQVMVRDWRMNALRLPLSNWIYRLDPTIYLGRLDPIVQEANSAGLYVILDLHDDGKSGSPYGDYVNLPKSEDAVFWKALAAHYKDNTMVMFDVFNEPKATDWGTWLHGGGLREVPLLLAFRIL